jgi:hypothetical protein
MQQLRGTSLEVNLASYSDSMSFQDDSYSGWTQQTDHNTSATPETNDLQLEAGGSSSKSAASTSNTLDLDQQRYRAEMAKEMAELKRGKAEEIRQKKEEILVKVALANLKEAEKRAELIELELNDKKRQLMTINHMNSSIN